MKKTQIVMTLAGLLVLTGCTKPVMQDSHYIPAKDDKAVNANRQYDDFASDNKTTLGSIPPATADNQQAVQPAPAPVQNSASYRKYAPMEDVKSSGGISDVRPARKTARKGKKSPVQVAKGGTYVVKSGDYPAKIAKKFGVSVSALLAANKMTAADAKKLQIGQKLVIPAKGAAKKQAAAKNAGKTAAKPEISTESGTYVVQSGDFPARIARRLKVKVSDLLKANNLTLESAKKLQIGQKLVIPGKGVQKPAAKQETVEKAVDKPAQQDTPTHSEESNIDSANEIAKKIEDNSAAEKNGDNFDGSTDPYELAEDTTFQALSAKLNIPEATLRRLNPEFTGDNLSKGNCVMIPGKK